MSQCRLWIVLENGEECSEMFIFTDMKNQENWMSDFLENSAAIEKVKFIDS